MALWRLQNVFRGLEVAALTLPSSGEGSEEQVVTAQRLMTPPQAFHARAGGPLGPTNTGWFAIAFHNHPLLFPACWVFILLPLEVLECLFY